MTSPLLPVLAPRESVTWSRAKVSAITGNTLTLNWQGTQVPNVPRLASYTPAVGHFVHVLVYGPTGILVLGNEVLSAVVVPPAPPSATTVVSSLSGTYNSLTNVWVTDVVNESLTTAGVFIYPVSGYPAVTTGVSEFQIQLTVSADSSTMTGLSLHRNAELSGSVKLTGDVIPVNVVPGETQWVNLPLSWSASLTAGDASGIALISSANTPSSVTVTGGTLKVSQL